jgi:hypothetical protein
LPGEIYKALHQGVINFYEACCGMEATVPVEQRKVAMDLLTDEKYMNI